MEIKDCLLNALKSDNYLDRQKREGFPDILYKTLGDKTLLIILWSGYNFNKLSTIQYSQFIEKIKEYFSILQYNKIELLSIVITDSIDNIKKFNLDNDTHWGVFEDSEKLIVFENQSYDFYGLREVIENCLIENNKVSEVKRGYISLSIILINIIVYFLVAKDKAYALGATSWSKVVVEKEYYRIITSMFLHADFKHLINNMFIIYVLSNYLEVILKTFKYVILYLSSGIVASMISILYYHIKDMNVMSIGASGAAYGLLGAFITHMILYECKNSKRLIKRMIIIASFLLVSSIGREIISKFSNSVISKTNIDHAAHIAGGASGIITMVVYKFIDLKKNNYNKTF